MRLKRLLRLHRFRRDSPENAHFKASEVQSQDEKPKTPTKVVKEKKTEGMDAELPNREVHEEFMREALAQVSHCI